MLALQARNLKCSAPMGKGQDCVSSLKQSKPAPCHIIAEEKLKVSIQNSVLLIRYLWQPKHMPGMPLGAETAVVNTGRRTSSVDQVCELAPIDCRTKQAQRQSSLGNP